ncbi:MAG TPA: EAL domain-containing protein [Tepidisphaeraceae bacterium]|nr:EAL domain-containing protein [Tepidisphaeraceae bacterium]
MSSVLSSPDSARAPDLGDVIVRATASLIVVLDRGGRIVQFNPACERATGYAFDEVRGRAFFDFLVPPDDAPGVRAVFDRLIAGEFPNTHENDWVTKAGARRRVVWTNSAVVGPGGAVELVVACGNDVTDRRQIEVRLRESEERYALAVRGANDGIWDWDLRAGTLYVSARWRAMAGCAGEPWDASPESWLARVHPDDRPRVREEIDRHLAGQTPHVEIEHRMRCGAAEGAEAVYRWYLVRGLAIRNARGVAYRMAGSLGDVTDRKAVEERLVREALYDSLTGLANRVLIRNRLEQVLARARRNPEARFAVLFLDLDRFKVINDGLGHWVGDELLVEVARRLQTCVRPSDTVARLGGDEFIVLLEDLRADADAVRVAERVQELLKSAFVLGDHEVFTSASVGIVAGSGEYASVQDLLRDADAAMYRAKALGKSRHELFDEAMHEQALAVLELETDLRHAIERGEFFPVFQPIVALAGGALRGFEALVRWRHPDKGMVSPAAFIPVLEETGLIVPLGAWMLRESCRMLAGWRARFPWVAAAGVRVSVNVSGKQFARGDLAAEVRAALAESGLPPACLALEITESVMMTNADASADVLRGLRELGVTIHVDDFGVGYSSLAQLHRFPIDALKVDRAFVSRLGKPGTDDDRARDTTLVRTILALAHNLGMGVTAEGIETEAQLEALKALGCTLGQGYLFAKPLAAGDVEAMLGREEAGTALKIPA